MNNTQYRTMGLLEALVLVESVDEASRFITDLCTPAEIKALNERWKVCQLLSLKKFSHKEIKEISGASLATIGRVSRFLNEEHHNGYKNLLEKIKNKTTCNQEYPILNLAGHSLSSSTGRDKIPYIGVL